MGVFEQVGRALYGVLVRGLRSEADRLLAHGKSEEEVARIVHGRRREIGEVFKALTPPQWRAQIRQRNKERYGDPLGPSVDWLRDHGKSWKDIIDSACRTGGGDLGFK